MHLWAFTTTFNNAAVVIRKAPCFFTLELFSGQSTKYLPRVLMCCRNPHCFLKLFSQSAGCSLGVRGQRILRLLHRILRLNFACFPRKHCPSIISLLLLNSYCFLLLLQFLIKTLELRSIEWGSNRLRSFFLLSETLSLR